MTDRDALLRTILAHPHDDTPRLVLADWLDENGESERAAFVRARCGPPTDMNMVWTTAPPAAAPRTGGMYYWCRLPGWYADRVVKVEWVLRYDPDEEWVLMFGEEYMTWQPVTDAPAGTRWSDRPVPKPADPPAEVTR